MIQNKQSLLNLISRAERGVLLTGEAQILRDAVEMLDEMCMCVGELGVERESGDYDPSTTQTFRAIGDDCAPGRP